MNKEFIQAIEDLEKERHIPKDVLIEAIESALVSALSKSFPDDAVLFIFTNYGDKSIYEPIVKQCHERQVKIIWISSTDLDSSLLNKNDIYISTHEVELESPPLLTKLTSFLLVQFIIEYLRHNIDKQEA